MIRYLVSKILKGDFFITLGNKADLMKQEILEHIVHKTGIPDIVDILADNLSGSELNTLLLEVFNRSLRHISPALLLQQYRLNRFVHPATTDMIGLLSLELKVLEFLRSHHFQPVELSPAAQLGSCSVIGPADQKKIISATRNTEIVADATNSLALHIADLKRSGHPANSILRFCTTHRHVRTQEFKAKGFTAHFKIGCLVSSGVDTGSCQFETTSLQEHIAVLCLLLQALFHIQKIRVRLLARDGYDERSLLLQRISAHLADKNAALDVSVERPEEPNNYYKGLQFKIMIGTSNGEMEIADGGFVNWTQQLLNNKKERLLISGFGLGLLYALQNP